MNDVERTMRLRARDACEAIKALGDNSGLYGDAVTRMKKVPPTVAQLFVEVTEWLQRDDVSEELVMNCFSMALAGAADALASLDHELSTNFEYIGLRAEMKEHVQALKGVAHELLGEREPPPRQVEYHTRIVIPK